MRIYFFDIYEVGGGLGCLEKKGTRDIFRKEKKKKKKNNARKLLKKFYYKSDLINGTID